MSPISGHGDSSGELDERFVLALAAALAPHLRDEILDAVQRRGFPESILTVAEVAEALRVSPRKVEDFIRSGELVPIWIGHQRRFSARSVVDFLERASQAKAGPGRG